MKPIPAQNPADSDHVDVLAVPAIEGPLTSKPATYSAANRRSSQSTAQRAYPWLLCASTAIAAAFCILYITKPVVSTTANDDGSNAATEHAAVANSRVADALLPNRNHLPGESATPERPPTATPASLPSPPLHSTYEETNLKVQHILSAEAPGGHLNRIDIDVPVLYQSRHLRWSAEEIARADELLRQLMDYQDKHRQLKQQGEQLWHSWNQLIGRSIPTSKLRADSPTLPENQLTGPEPKTEEGDDAIQIQVSEP